jgi:hypothetical protein
MMNMHLGDPHRSEPHGYLKDQSEVRRAPVRLQGKPCFTDMSLAQYTNPYAYEFYYAQAIEDIE